MSGVFEKASHGDMWGFLLKLLEKSGFAGEKRATRWRASSLKTVFSVSPSANSFRWRVPEAGAGRRAVLECRRIGGVMSLGVKYFDAFFQYYNSFLYETHLNTKVPENPTFKMWVNLLP